MNTPESTPSAASPPTITGTTALMQDIAAMVETHATRAVESATKELRKHLAAANQGAEINAHVNTALVDKNAAQAAQIAELRQRLEDLDDGGIHSCGPTCQRPMCVMRRERDALKASNKAAYMEGYKDGLDQEVAIIARATKAESDLAALRLLAEKNDKIELLLIAVARAAWQLCDNTEEDGEHLMTCDATDFNVLSETLDVLDLLPNPDGEAATGPRKAEYQLALAPDSCAKEVEELRKDKARLDWLADSPFVNYTAVQAWLIPSARGPAANGVRAAIDAARGAKEDK